MERKDLSLSDIIRRLEKEGPEKWVPESYKEKDSMYIDLNDRIYSHQFDFNIIIEDFWIKLHARPVVRLGLFKQRKEGEYNIIIYERSFQGYWDWVRPVISFQGKEIKNLFDKVHRELREYWRQEDKETAYAIQRRRQETLNKLGSIFNQ